MTVQIDRPKLRTPDVLPAHSVQKMIFILSGISTAANGNIVPWKVPVVFKFENDGRIHFHASFAGDGYVYCCILPEHEDAWVRYAVNVLVSSVYKAYAKIAASSVSKPIRRPRFLMIASD